MNVKNTLKLYLKCSWKTTYTATEHKYVFKGVLDRFFNPTDHGFNQMHPVFTFLTPWEIGKLIGKKVFF